MNKRTLWLLLLLLGFDYVALFTARAAGILTDPYSRIALVPIVSLLLGLFVVAVAFGIALVVLTARTYNNTRKRNTWHQ